MGLAVSGLDLPGLAIPDLDPTALGARLEVEARAARYLDGDAAPLRRFC